MLVIRIQAIKQWFAKLVLKSLIEIYRIFMQYFYSFGPLKLYPTGHKIRKINL